MIAGIDFSNGTFQLSDGTSAAVRPDLLHYGKSGAFACVVEHRDGEILIVDFSREAHDALLWEVVFDDDGDTAYVRLGDELIEMPRRLMEA